MSLTIEQKLKHYRMSKAEYDRACELVGHPLREIEWPLFSALWSEHCSYKSSKIHLRKFYNKNARVLEAEGENAGVVDLGEGERVAFKMESHNHPSFIEPYQGAATGVGGILRDIFTMGARPIALADYLCFGEPKAPRMEYLVNGVVRGIGGYGNCVGVPTVTGQTNFHSSYNNNILVNAMAVGLFRPNDKVALSKAKGPGNLVVYVGAKTGKDGVHGASMASESFDSDSEKKKPNVQIGDPYFEKLLIESCLEVIQKDLVVAIQDMGAAGLTSSSFEMASKGQVGMEMHLDKVPLRDSSITPEEILLSESQERMLMVVEPAKFAAIQDVFAHWGLDAAVVGHILPERIVRLLWQGEVLIEIDPDILVEHPPKYERAFNPWSWKNRKADQPVADQKNETRWGTPDQASRRFITRQYDQRVGLKTVQDCEFPVALIKLPDSGRGLGIAVGCRPEIMRIDAKLGGYDSIAYPALQMACQGIQALAITDCLNFGNPEKPEIMSEFVASVEAISEMAKALDAPVVSGNVSFYNETLGQNITSTPATGLVGLRSNIEHLKASTFQAEGEQVYLVSLNLIHLHHAWGTDPSQPAQWSGTWDTAKVVKFIEQTRKLAALSKVSSLRAVSSPGVATSLLKMSLAGIGVGQESIHASEKQPNGLYQIIVSGTDLSETLPTIFVGSSVSITEIGQTRKDKACESQKLTYEKAWGKHFENLA
ncbi:MAG: phosphoribosylformylglycinamidine synthase [Pseudomonadota bacterium]|jgi:phosphoribosylformylglycinamidine synthase